MSLQTETIECDAALHWSHQFQMIEQRLQSLEVENQQLKQSNLRMELELQQCKNSQISLLKIVKSLMPASLQNDNNLSVSKELDSCSPNTKKQSDQPSRIGLFIVNRNKESSIVEDYLYEKFPNIIFPYNQDENNRGEFKLVFILFSRGSGSLRNILQAQELLEFQGNLSKCWFLCAHYSIWDDKCSYNELLERFNSLGVLQFNVWSGKIETKSSPITTQSLQKIENLVQSSPTKRFSNIFRSLSFSNLARNLDV